MADNLAVTAGSGTTIAADEIGGVKYQRVKLTVGADGTAVDVGAGSGTVGTDTPRVTIGTDDAMSAALVSVVKAEDAAHGSGDKGIMALSRRADTASSSAGTDGDYATLNTDANGRLHVIDVTGTAVQFAEDAAHTSGDKGVPALVRRKDSPAVSSGTDGDYSTLDVSANGRAWIEDPHKNISVTPTVSATPDYSQYDAVGGKQTLTNAVLFSGGIAKLVSLTVIDKSAQSPQMDVVIFNADPSAATITDNSAFDPSTDVTKIIARIPIVTADWQLVTSGIGVANIAQDKLGQVLTASGSANLYAAVVARGAINLASTTDLIFTYGFAQK